MPLLRVAARPSRLSLEQVRIALEWLRREIPNLAFEVVPVITKGDVDRSKPIYQTGLRGAFEREVDRAVLDGMADIAIHSLKDLPSKLPNGLEIVSLPPRASPFDAIVPARDRPTLAPQHLPPDTRVAAGSARRKAMILHANPRVKVGWIRGNIDTRLRRLDEGASDYLVVAEAALERLGVSRRWIRLPVVPFTPAPGQGLIAIVAPSESGAAKLLRGTSHPVAEAEAAAERAFLERVGGACGRPLGAVARYSEGVVNVIVGVYSPDGSRAFWASTSSRNPVEAGQQAAELARELEKLASEGSAR